MCGQLRQTAMALETAASAANEDSRLLGDVKQKFEDLKLAVTNYNAYLQTIGV